MRDTFEVFKEISIVNEKKILLFVIDGLGGTNELETANLPNIDSLAKKSLCGTIIPVSEGITPGSAPAHLALFGYNPFEYEIKRGVLEALGVGLELDKNDLACRANFATIDYKTNLVIDRRAGRIPTEECKKLTELLQKQIKKIDDVEITIKSAKEHRFVIVFKGEGLSDDITENDPQKENLKPKEIIPLNEKAKKTAHVVNKFLNMTTEILKDIKPANYVLLRGFAKYPTLPTLQEIFKLNPACIATYPMYKGLAKLVGMKALETGETIDEQINTLTNNRNGFDFFYFHIKKADSLGEDGDFLGKVAFLEKIDTYIPKLLDLKFDVFILTGDHSTPTLLKSHSWHPVPVLLYSSIETKNEISKFTEYQCLTKGNLGKIKATDVLPLAMAHSFKFAKFGP